MKKVKIIISILCLSICVGCSNKVESQDNSYKNEENVVAIMDENENVLEEKDPMIIYDRYKIVDKNKLKYERVSSSVYFHETETAFVGSPLSDTIPNIDNKKYDNILSSYTFASELISTTMTYDKAVEYAKSVFPDDIKEERVKFDNNTGIIFIVYSSSKGNFVAGLNTKILLIQDGEYTYDKGCITGISYLKERL